MTKQQSKASESDGTELPDQRFIEIVNWKKAQPRMKGRDNAWMKLYTSLLDNDAFAGLDDPARVLLFLLWLYASRSGQHILPADPKWLLRKIPTLNRPPNLQPLLEAADIYGNPTPFVRYCNPPKLRKRQPRTTARTTVRTQCAQNDREERQSLVNTEDITVRKQAQKSSKNRLEENRVEESRKDPAQEGVQSGNGREDKKRKEKKQTQPRQNRPEKSDAQAKPEDRAQNPKPADPTKPDALGRDKALTGPQPAPGSDNPPRPAQARRRPMYADGYDRHDLQLGKRIFQALRLHGDPDSGDGYSEVCSFAAVWHTIHAQLSRAPPEVRDKLGVRAIKEAQKIARRKSANNKSAVWIDTIRKIANKRESEITGDTHNKAGPCKAM